MHNIKVLGIQRTGTNYLAHLLDANVISRRTTKADTAWKHGPVSKLDEYWDSFTRLYHNNRAVVIIKNPYTWYTSILKWVKCTANTNYDGFGKPCPENMFKRYNSLYAEHKKFLTSSTKDTYFKDNILIRYEDLIEDPRRELHRLADKFMVKLVQPYREVYGIPQSRPFSESQRNYYLAQRPTYGSNTVKRVTAAVDWELMDFYGYKKIGD